MTTPTSALGVGEPPVLKTTPANILSFHAESKIQHRYAKTTVTSKVDNTNKMSTEIFFRLVLPESAFISQFQMEIDDKVYKANVKEKEKAKEEYNVAVSAGRTAAHVSQSVRDSNKFTVSVNVEANKQVTFKLTYEELLKRELSTYKHVFNIDPGQLVADLSVVIYIEEFSKIIDLHVPPLQETDEIQSQPTSQVNTLAKIEHPNPNEAVIHWAPTLEEQKSINKDGVKCQLIVRYDVDRLAHPEQILINDGYFVHFYAPNDLKTLRKHVTFVLDASGSMCGRKMEQLKAAMKTILSDLNPDDLLSIIIFSTGIQVWDLEKNYGEGDFIPQPIEISPDLALLENSEALHGSSVIVSASATNIEKAKQFVDRISTYCSTNIYGALKKGIQVALFGKRLSESNSTAQQNPESMIIFLTDGQPNIEESNTDTIVNSITEANNITRVAIFSLAFGDDADMEFLKKLSLRNSGFARKIYEASDAALQLNQFYKQVSSPLLSNVTFKYQENQVVSDSLTRTNFHTLFDGSELIISGRLHANEITGELNARCYTGLICPRIVKPEIIPGHKRNFMERMWAFLTIQQLLDKISAEEDNASLKQKALELALKYSFVTSLTSLIVVKPDDTTAEAETKRADIAEDLMFQSSPVMMCAPSYPESMSRRLAFMPKSPAGMNMTTSVSVSPVSPNYDMHQRVPLSVSGMNMFGNASIPQSSPGLFGMSKANAGVPMSAPGVTSFGFGSSQQSSSGLFGMPQANIGIPLSTPGMTSFGFGSSQQNSGEKDKNTDTNKGTDGSHLQVSGLHVATNIQCDHATVILKFVFYNQIGVANNTEFKIPLPSSAILSYCLMEVDGIEYKGVLDKTEAAQEQFKSAKLENKTAFLMRLSSSNELTITVNVEIYKDLTFKLTYDDFLREIVNHYEHEIPIIYGKIVEDLHVEAQIQGSYDITSVNIPYLPGSLAGAQGAESGLKLERRQPNVIKVVWDPTRSEQEKLHKTAPLLLSFDLDKKSLPGQVLKSIPDVLKERVSIKKIVDGFMKDPTKQLQALELSLKHNFLSQLTAFYAVKLKD